MRLNSNTHLDASAVDPIAEQYKHSRADQLHQTRPYKMLLRNHIVVLTTLFRKVSFLLFFMETMWMLQHGI